MSSSIFPELQTKVATGQMEIASHAAQRMLQRRITVQHLATAILNGQIIEDYPEDKYGPS